MRITFTASIDRSVLKGIVHIKVVSRLAQGSCTRFFTPENGGTQLLLGSHNNKWPLGQGGARVVQAPAGSVVAYDSRTIHRGLGNETSVGRPALIFCYDRVETPPPGCGTVGSVGTSYQGRLVDILTGVRNMLLSPK